MHGTEATYLYIAAKGGALPSREANAVSVLESFWPQAKATDVQSERPGQLLLRYESPTKSRTKLAQSVLTQLCSSEGGAVGAPISDASPTFH